QRGGLMPGVREILEDLRSELRVTSLLLTGNTRAGALAKLRCYGLDGMLDEGAFCTGSRSRLQIARQALALAHRKLGELSPDSVFVIGDTPYDVACANS